MHAVFNLKDADSTILLIHNYTEDVILKALLIHVYVELATRRHNTVTDALWSNERSNPHAPT